MTRRVIAVVEARMGSTRLPGKALAEIAGRPMVAHVMERAAAVPGIDAVVLATTIDASDDALVAWARAAGWPTLRGSVDDVLDRVYGALAAHPADAVVRVTGDCPLLDPAVSGRVVAALLARAGEVVDYASNVHPPTYPDGLDTEICSAAALERAWAEARRASDREHVTAYLWRHPERFRLVNVAHREDLSAHRWTVDTPADLDFVREVYTALGDARIFGMAEVLDLLRARPALAALNAGQRRNEGYERSRRRDAASPPAAGRASA